MEMASLMFENNVILVLITANQTLDVTKTVKLLQVTHVLLAEEQQLVDNAHSFKDFKTNVDHHQAHISDLKKMKKPQKCSKMKSATQE